MSSRYLSITASALAAVALLACGTARAGEVAEPASDRTLVLALEVDRDGARLVGFTVKDRAFAPRAEAPLPEAYAAGAQAQIEVALLGPGAARHTQRVALRGLCLEHGPETPPEIEGDTIRLHRETFLVEEPELAGFDQVEVAFHTGHALAPARSVLGLASLDAARFTTAGGAIPYDDLAIAALGSAPPPPAPLTPGTLHFPEEYGDTDIFTLYGNASEVAKRINIVIVPDGYTYAQKATMQAHALAAVNAFRAKSPYKEHDRFINYILVYAYSTEDGTDQCDCAIVRDTAMSTRFPLEEPTCGHDDNRCLFYGGGCDPTDSSANIAATELRAPAQDTTLVMVNTARYGGCGGARATYSAGDASATEIAIHELGHSLANLDDEYGGDPACGAGSGINTSMDSTNGAWPEWIADLGAPVEGAKYYDQCIYRPTASCDMRTLGPEFCPVCTQQWALTYFGHARVNPTAPLESQSPASPAYTNVGMPRTFALGTRLASGPSITNAFTWKLQGPGFPVATTVATGTDSHTRSFSPSGAYTLTSEIVADTNLIKPPKNGPNVDTASWTVNVCDPTLACDGGGPYTVECAGGTGTVELHGSAPTTESLSYFWTTSCPGGSFSDQTAKDTTLTLDGPPPCPVDCDVTLNAVHDCETSYVCSSDVTVVDTTDPTVDPPAPLALECNTQGGVLKTDPQVVDWLGDASATDSCNSATVSDDAPALIPSGCAPGLATTVTFTGTDECTNQATEESAVTVTDSTAPTLVVPEPIVLECSAQGGVPLDDPRLIPWFAAAQASDVCGSVKLANDAPALFPSGCGDGITTIVTFTATDDCGLETSLTSSVTVKDTTGPLIDVQPLLDGGHAYLWPPQHGYVDFDVEDTGIVAHDTCDGVTFEFSTCASNQQENANGTGDGNSVRDCVMDGVDLHLRAERDQTCRPAGRIYTMTIDAIDNCGNRTRSMPFPVTVPHNNAHSSGVGYSANPGSNQNDTRPGLNGTYGTGCGSARSTTRPAPQPTAPFSRGSSQE